jgi:tetratricopeptide (TPR) repeat protein
VPFVVNRAVAVTTLLVVALASTAAHADPAADAKEHFNRGVKLYNLGHFQEAIPEFEKAYDADPAPILLFNIAQSHRQNGNKERALFFYRRYLEQEPNAAKRADVEQRMKELAQSLEQENEQKQKPPTEVTPPPPTPTPPQTAPQPTSAAPTAQPPVVVAGPAAPSGVTPWRMAVALGPAFVGFSGAQNVSAPVLFGLQLGGSYEFLHGPSELRAGVSGLYASLPYTVVGTTPAQTSSSSFWGALLTLDYAYRVIEPLSLGAGIGLGIVWWAGLSEGNPFTVQGVAASGAIPMPTLALSLHAEYLITPHLFVNFTPELLLSKTTSDGLSEAVSSIHRFDLDVGVGYRF